MSFKEDIKVLYHLTLAPRSGDTHAERMESFYKAQAPVYDGFRERLLKGRREMLSRVPWGALENGVWVDLGAGTGANAEFVGEKLPRLKSVHLVDLSKSLLAVADERIWRNGWKNIQTWLHDATTFTPPEREVDLVTFSYSLTMVPDWTAAIDHAFALLRPGGYIGVADFFVSRKHEPSTRKRHDWFTRTFWPTWFSFDDVFLNPEHPHYLNRKFETLCFEEGRTRPPYFPFAAVPHYRLVGRKPA